MTKRSVHRLAWILALLPLAAVGVLYPRLPQMVPTHWALDGTVTYSAKPVLWLLAGLSPAMLLLMRVLPRIDPRKKNYETFGSYYNAFIVGMLLLLLAVNLITLSESLWPGRISVGRAVTVGVGILFAFIGHILPRVKSNFFMGVRTPWTLSDPDVWDRTQRLGGKLFFWAGIVLVPCALVLPEKVTFALLMAGVVVISALPAALSFWWYRKKENEER